MSDDLSTRLLDAALPHTAFDGWSETTFRAAIADTGTDPAVARGLFPRGALDLAVAFHRRGDAAMADRLRAMDLTQMRFRDRIATAVRTRLEVTEDREAVRRGTTLFSLPPYAPEGAKLIWGTADRIWSELGDDTRDFNWYTKRATLAAVYSATVLYWLGDESIDHQATWEFLDRRIADVMRIEEVKAKARANPLLNRLMAGPDRMLGRVRPPRNSRQVGVPGGWTAPR